LSARGHGNSGKSNIKLAGDFQEMVLQSSQMVIFANVAIKPKPVLVSDTTNYFMTIV
jgi:hypothetical protein